MGLQASMRAAVSGMNKESQVMGAVSDNTANSGTYGFKRAVVQGMQFVTGSSSSTSYSAGGVTANVQHLNDEQGTIEAGTSPTDLAISGNGFFIVSTAPDTTTGEVRYTRAGDFRPDLNGRLKNSEGYFLLGWDTDSAGVPTATDTSLTNSLVAIDTTALSGFSQVTSTITDKAVLSSSATTGSTAQQTTTVYDALGVAHPLTLTWTKTNAGTAGTSIGWTLSATTNDGIIKIGNTLGSAYSAVTAVPLLFSATDGTPLSYNGVATSGATMPNLYIEWNAGTTSAGPTTIAVDMGAIAGTTGVVCQGSASNVITTRTFTANGAVFGNLVDLSVDGDGVMSAIFDNGLNQKFYKVPIGVFNNPNGLNSQDGQAFTSTSVSGNALIRSANTNGAGKIVPNSLEGSTVDIANEFANMIVSQQSFSANGTVIRTVDQMMAELARLKG